jgi:glucose-6-phosphate dehydrogenase assembly protein OpcA
VTFNTPEEECVLASTTGNQLEHVSDLIYLGFWVATTKKDLRIRKAKARAACHKLKKSNLRRALKMRLYVATVESILSYGSETWSLTELLRKRIDGCLARMLRMALNVD